MKSCPTHTGLLCGQEINYIGRVLINHGDFRLPNTTFTSIITTFSGIATQLVSSRLHLHSPNPFSHSSQRDFKNHSFFSDFLLDFHLSLSRSEIWPLPTSSSCHQPPGLLSLFLGLSPTAGPLPHGFLCLVPLLAGFFSFFRPQLRCHLLREASLMLFRATHPAFPIILCITLFLSNIDNNLY